MKKLLAMLLALCMIMSCMVITVAAEGETVTEHVANKIRFDAFGNFSGGEQIEYGDSIFATLAAGEYGIGGVLWQFNGDSVSDDKKAFDVTGCDALEFMLYLSNPDILDGRTFEMELTSYGKSDGAEESSIVGVLSDYAEGEAFKEGWNKISVPLSGYAGGCKMDHVNWIRFFSRTDQDGEAIVIPEGEALDIMIKEMAFVSGGSVVHTVPMDYDGWNWTYADFPGTLNFDLPTGGIGPGNLLTQYLMETPVDVSNMKYLDIYCKITNGADLSKVFFEVELCSDATEEKNCDHCELHYQGFFNNLRDGWHNIRIPLAALTGGSADGTTCDLSKINFIRFYCAGGTVHSDAALEIAYYQFSDAGNHNYQEYQFAPSSMSDGSATDAKHNTGDVGEGTRGYIKQISSKGTQAVPGFGQQVYGDAYVTYQLALNYIIPNSLFLVAPFGGFDLKVEVATQDKDEEYKTIWDPTENPLIQSFAPYIIDLGRYVSGFDSTGYNLYIRISDANPSTSAGYGAFDGGVFMDNALFYVNYSDWEVDPDTVIVTEDDIMADLEEMTATDDVRPLFGCNTAIGSWEVDRKNFQAGASSLSYTIGIWEETAADGSVKKVEHTGQADFTFKFEDFVGEESIDATGFDTLEFDMYISDIEAFMNLQFADHCFELTSSGVYDQEETSWRMTDWFANVDGGTPVDGWNKIRLSLEGGAADLSRVNFIRFYFVGISNAPVVNSEEEGIILKLDNLRFTKYKAQQIEAERPAATEMAQKIYDTLKDLPLEFDKDDQAVIDQFAANYDAWVALKDSLKDELGALSNIAQELVGDIVIEGAEDDSAKLLSSFQSALNKYKRYKEDLEKNPPDDNPGTETPGTETPGTETPGTETPGTETPGTDTPGTDTPGTDTPGPTDPEKSNTTTIIIIVVVAVVVVAAGVVAFIVIKKKKA